MLVSPQRVFCQMESGERSVLLIKIGVINDSSRLSDGLGVLSIPLPPTAVPCVGDRIWHARAACGGEGFMTAHSWTGEI